MAQSRGFCSILSYRDDCELMRCLQSNGWFPQASSIDLRESEIGGRYSLFVIHQSSRVIGKPAAIGLLSEQVAGRGTARGVRNREMVHEGTL